MTLSIQPGNQTEKAEKLAASHRLCGPLCLCVPQAAAAAAQADLLRQQEELEKKAAELDRREQQLQTRQASSGLVASLGVM